MSQPRIFKGAQEIRWSAVAGGTQPLQVQSASSAVSSGRICEGVVVANGEWQVMRRACVYCLSIDVVGKSGRWVEWKSGVEA
jgi:hypothetical protein